LQALEKTYDELLRSPALDHDPWSRPNLQTFRPRHEALWRALDRHLEAPRTTIADVGCHNGFFLRLARELGFTQFIAVDYFPLPRDRSFLTGLEGVRFLRENFNRDGFLSELESASVDTVVSTEVLEHLYHHPAGYLAEVWRVLRAGGLLLLSTPNPGTLAKAIRSLRGIPVTWGDLEFARTPKVVPGTGEPLAVWDIHFREYQPRDVLTLLGDLPGARVLESGFLVNAPSLGSSAPAQLAKSMLWSLGLGHVRVLAATQYHVVRKQA
jgi:SAM-dependent methyltransferase